MKLKRYNQINEEVEGNIHYHNIQEYASELIEAQYVIEEHGYIKRN